MPLQIPIRGNPTFGTFRSGWSEPHFVGFRLTRRDSKVVDSVEQLASALVGSKVTKPNFDITWRVYHNDSLLAQGSGRDPLSGIFGATIGIGLFRAKSQQVYRVEACLGPDFMQIMQGEPVLEVGVATAAPGVGIALAKALSKLLRQVAGWVWVLIGMIFAGATVKFYLRRPRPA